MTDLIVYRKVVNMYRAMVWPLTLIMSEQCWHLRYELMFYTKSRFKAQQQTTRYTSLNDFTCNNLMINLCVVNLSKPHSMHRAWHDIDRKHTHWTHHDTGFTLKETQQTAHILAKYVTYSMWISYCQSVSSAKRMFLIMFTGKVEKENVPVSY